MSMVSPFLSAADGLAQQRQKVQLTPEQSEKARVSEAWLRAVATAIPTATNDQALALAMSRAALDGDARAEMLRVLIALEGYTQLRAGRPAMAGRWKMIADQVEVLIKEDSQ